MSNLIKVATIDIILSLHRRGWSQRRIARELDVNRETVARYLKQAEAASKPANAPTGSDTPEAASKPANAPTGSDDASRAGPETQAPHPSRRPRSVLTKAPVAASECEPWRETIQSMCDLGLERPTHLPGSHHRTQLHGQLLQRPSLRPSPGADA